MFTLLISEENLKKKRGNFEYSYCRLTSELKSIEAFAPVHEAQILTYMKFANKTIGLLINFNVTLLINGIKRYKN